MILRHCRELIGCLVVHSCFVDACSANTTLANACDQAWNQVTGPSPCATGALAFASEACVRLCRGSSLHVSLLLRCLAFSARVAERAGWRFSELPEPLPVQHAWLLLDRHRGAYCFSSVCDALLTRFLSLQSSCNCGECRAPSFRGNIAVLMQIRLKDRLVVWPTSARGARSMQTTH